MAKSNQVIISWEQSKEIYTLTEPGQLLNTLSSTGESWMDWLASHKSFTFQGQQGRLSVQKETRPRSQEGYWYAYQRQGKRMVKQYLGRSSEVTLERLENAARSLALRSTPDQTVETTTRRESTSLVAAPGGRPIEESSRTVEPVLEPKLRLPRLHSTLVARPRLLKRLDESLERKLTLISAPAGFGKTTLVRQWLAERFEIYPTAHTSVPKIAWVSLDAGDNDPIRFWRYVITACQLAGFSSNQTALEQLAIPPQPPYHPVSLQAVLTTFLNDLTRTSGTHILVLEDYHVISSAQLHQSLAFFLENLLPNLHLVIITRYDPPLALARLRGQGELSELHQAELRFSAQEAWDFLLTGNSYQFSEEAVSQLDRHLEGWPAGLRLLSLSLQSLPSQSKIEQFIKTFTGSHRPVQDYFVTEVLNILPLPIQNFILQTSILERLTPALCYAVTGTADCAQLLQTLEKNNLFLELLDGDGEWYRYHALFAEAMQQELRTRQGSAAQTELYNRAGRWFEENSLLPDAVEAALHAKNYEQVANLIKKIIGSNHFLVGLQFFQELSEFYTFSRWLKALPTNILQQYPLLCLSYASVLFFISIQEYLVMPTAALERIWQALDWAEQGWQGENQGGQLAQVFAFRALLTGMAGQMEEALNWAKAALEGLPKEEQPWRGMVLNVLGTYELYKGQIDRAKYYLNEARINTDAIGNHNFRRANMGLLAWGYREQGELNQAAEYHKLVLAEAREVGDKDDIVHSLLGLAELSYEWNDLETAWQQTQEVLDLLALLPTDLNRSHASLVQARILHARGQVGAALQRLNAELSLIRPPEIVTDYQFYREIRLWQARLYLDSGDLTRFENWFNSLTLGASGQPIEVYAVQQVNETLLIARWLTERGEWNKALLLLEPWLSEMQVSSRFRLAMKIRLSLALALAAGKKLPEARRQLQTVLSQAHIEGFIRLFLDEGEPLSNLLRATPLPTATAGKALNQYRQKILEAFEETSSPSASPSSAAGGEPLSPQEQRVMALLGAGLSYPEIARQLVVSVNTIKTQVKSIYQKLNVNNRQQALEAIRQLKAV